MLFLQQTTLSGSPMTAVKQTLAAYSENVSKVTMSDAKHNPMSNSVNSGQLLEELIMMQY